MNPQQLVMADEYFQFQQLQELIEDRSVLSAGAGHDYYRKKKNYWRQLRNPLATHAHDGHEVGEKTWSDDLLFECSRQRIKRLSTTTKSC